MSPKKLYVVPKLIPRSISAFSEHEQQSLRAASDFTEDDYRTVVDLDRRYVEVSDNFCRLVGYDRAALIGKRYDELTAPDTNNLHTVFNMFCQLEYMHGLWMLVARTGTHILVRYEAWFRPDRLIESRMHTVGAGY